MTAATTSLVHTKCTYPSHVLFQFILTGYLRARATIETLESAILQPIPNKTTLIQAVENLAGTSSPFRENFTWEATHGILTTLKNNSILLLLSFQPETSNMLTLRRLAGKSWVHATELLELSNQSSTFLESTYEYSQFLKIVKKLFSSFKSLGLAILKSIKNFANNENVLYCLINHQFQLDRTYGPSFTLKTVKKTHKTLKSATSFLVDAYRKRGFERLIPNILQKMNAL